MVESNVSKSSRRYRVFWYITISLLGQHTVGLASCICHRRSATRKTHSLTRVCTTSLYISSKKKHLLSYTRSKRNAGRPRGRNWLTLLSLLVIFFILSDGVALHLFFLIFLLFFYYFLCLIFPLFAPYFFSDDAVD
ncbi:hypothetical protein D6C86_05413 [Aureobasidium pullulans]|nr:hypothetical protein D6C86_05413 [Aureobasidium pullulans]